MPEGSPLGTWWLFSIKFYVLQSFFLHKDFSASFLSIYVIFYILIFYILSVLLNIFHVEDILRGLGGVLGACLSCLSRVIAHSHLLRILCRPASVDGDVIPWNVLIHHPLQRLLSLGS